jgi:hypothetical protein
LTVAVAAALTPYTVSDSGPAGLYLLGIPVLAAAVPVVADLAGAPRIAADSVGAVFLAAWALLLGLGIGAVFLPGSFLLIAAVIIDVAARRPSAR